MKNMKWKNLAVAILASTLIYNGGNALNSLLHGFFAQFDAFKALLAHDALRVGIRYLHNLPVALWVCHRAKESIGNSRLWLFAVLISNLASLAIFIGALILEHLKNSSRADGVAEPVK